MFGWFTGKAPIDPPKVKDDACVKDTDELNPKGIKPCCACPDTKSARDNCFLSFDATEADEKCRDLVQRHIACMRGYGFKV